MNCRNRLSSGNLSIKCLKKTPKQNHILPCWLYRLPHSVLYLFYCLHYIFFFKSGGFYVLFFPKVFVLHQLQPLPKLRPKWTRVKMRLLPQTSLTGILGTWSSWPWLGRSVAGRQHGQNVNSGIGESGSHQHKRRLQKKTNKQDKAKPQKPARWNAYKVHFLSYWISCPLSCS